MKIYTNELGHMTNMATMPIYGKNLKKSSSSTEGGGRVVRWCWVNFQCRGVLQFGYSRARAYCARSRCRWGCLDIFTLLYPVSPLVGGRVVRWCWVNFQCRGVLQFGLQ